jgi:hypothetical protein
MVDEAGGRFRALKDRNRSHSLGGFHHIINAAKALRFAGLVSGSSNSKAFFCAGEATPLGVDRVVDRVPKPTKT